MVKTYNEEQIKDMLPHRDPFLFVEKMEIIEDGVEGIGYKNITMDMDFFKGHFPGNPIMPGVLQVEALAQTACFVAFSRLSEEDRKQTLGYFTTMEKIKFSHMVRPGDKLELRVELLVTKMQLYKFHGIAFVGGKKVAESTFTAVLQKVQ